MPIWYLIERMVRVVRAVGRKSVQAALVAVALVGAAGGTARSEPVPAGKPRAPDAQSVLLYCSEDLFVDCFKLWAPQEIVIKPGAAGPVGPTGKPITPSDDEPSPFVVVPAPGASPQQPALGGSPEPAPGSTASDIVDPSTPPAVGAPKPAPSPAPPPPPRPRPPKAGGGGGEGGLGGGGTTPAPGPPGFPPAAAKPPGDDPQDVATYLALLKAIKEQGLEGKLIVEGRQEDSAVVRRAPRPNGRGQR
ncbi:hypothetical protein WCLP8_1950002 [uncultured Gammaproteobacteria bacterium]